MVLYISDKQFDNDLLEHIALQDGLVRFDQETFLLTNDDGGLENLNQSHDEFVAGLCFGHFFFQLIKCLFYEDIGDFLSFVRNQTFFFVFFFETFLFSYLVFFLILLFFLNFENFSLDSFLLLICISFFIFRICQREVAVYVEANRFFDYVWVLALVRDFFHDVDYFELIRLLPDFELMIIWLLWAMQFHLGALLQLRNDVQHNVTTAFLVVEQQELLLKELVSDQWQ